VTRSSKSYDAEANNDVVFGDMLLFSSSRDFAGGPGVAATSEARFLRFMLSPDNSWPNKTIPLLSNHVNATHHVN